MPSEIDTSRFVIQKECLFCNPPQDKILSGNDLAYVFRDGFPVTEGHALVIPKRHISSYFELTEAEVRACTALLYEYHTTAQTNDPSISGFNIGINVGTTAGQTIMHCHIHLIPRRHGDVEDPAGGIRNTIPGKGNYKKSLEENRVTGKQPGRDG